MAPDAGPGRHARIVRLLGFAVVGSIGFATDALVLLAATGLGLGPFPGRAVSFSVAVVVT